MSKNSPKQNLQALIEWQYSLKTNPKKSTPKPSRFDVYKEKGFN